MMERKISLTGFQELRHGLENKNKNKPNPHKKSTMKKPTTATPPTLKPKPNQPTKHKNNKPHKKQNTKPLKQQQPNKTNKTSHKTKKQTKQQQQNTQNKPTKTTTPLSFKCPKAETYMALKILNKKLTEQLLQFAIYELFPSMSRKHTFSTLLWKLQFVLGIGKIDLLMYPWIIPDIFDLHPQAEYFWHVGALHFLPVFL